MPSGKHPCGGLGTSGVPDSPIAQALSSPLTLVCDTYRSGDDIREFLEYCNADRLVSREDIVDHHLLDRVLPAAYAKRPGDPPLQYDLEKWSDLHHCLLFVRIHPACAEWC